MFLAGSKAYFSWLSDQEAEPDVGDLVSSVYAAMTAQRICRDQQMGLVPDELPRPRREWRDGRLWLAFDFEPE